MARDTPTQGRRAPEPAWPAEAAASPPAVPHAPGADAAGRVDLETAQRLVDRAVREAVHREERGAAMVDAQVGQATRRLGRANAALSFGVVLALAATAAAGVFVYRYQRDAAVLSAELGAGKSPGKPPTGTIPTRVYSGRAIYDSNKSALYVIGFLTAGRIGGCCTSFAVAPTVLATNAHCVLAYRKQGGTPIVIQNDTGGRTRLKIVASSIHPGYKPDTQTEDTPDVGLLRVDTRMPTVVTLASDAELRSIGPGDDVFVLGFPGRVMDPLSPLATFLQGHVGRTMGMDDQATTAAESVLLQHDAPTQGGNSGSPVFNQYGHVVAVHAAHLDEEDEQSIDGKKTTVLGASPFRLGMRIDLLQGVPAP